MTVRAILRAKGSDVVTMSPQASVAEAAGTLADNKIGAVVLLEGESVVGILSERDIVRLIARHGAECLQHRIADEMTLKVTTCTEDTSIAEAMEIMTHGRFRHLPVVAENRLIGIVSIGDVVKQRIEAAEREASQIRDYIVAG